MSEQLKYQSNTIYYTAHILATPKDGVDSSEFQFELSAGLWRGMGGWSQPSWEYHSAGDPFSTLEKAQEYIRGLSMSGYGYKIEPGTQPYFRKHRIMTEHYIEELE